MQAAVPGAIGARTIDDGELAGADLILLDLGMGLSPEAVVSLGPPVIAYGPHVDARALEAAVEAGCREALPRSKVFRRLPELLG